MLISLKHGFVFFCMPKCASNSVEAMLQPHCDIHLRGTPQVRHTNFRDWNSHVRPYLAEVAGVTDLETVAVFRHPLSWLASWYRFRARYELRRRGDPYSTAHLTFPEFVQAYVSRERPPFADVGSQYDFIRTDDDAVGIDRLFGYHDLGTLVDYFSQKTGAGLRLKALNVSPRSVRSADLLERIDAFRRRAVSALGRTSGAEPPLPVLPADLEQRLRSRIPRDFEIYQELL